MNRKTSNSRKAAIYNSLPSGTPSALHVHIANGTAEKGNKVHSDKIILVAWVFMNMSLRFLNLNRMVIYGLWEGEDRVFLSWWHEHMWRGKRMESG